jgi:hypothetical protein
MSGVQRGGAQGVRCGAKRGAAWRAALSMAFTLTLALGMLLVFPGVASAEPNTTIVGLTNASQQIDGQEVTIQGEVVGDILSAERGYKWLMLQDGGATISVLVAEHEVAKVTHLGRYGQVGTRLEVTGELQTDCADHDGLTDVHATKVVVIDEGSEVEHHPDPRTFQIGALLIIVGGCLLVLHWRLRERTR